MRFLIKTIILVIVTIIGGPAQAADFKPIVLDPSYNHDRWGTGSDGIIKDFRAYRSSFDSLDDDDAFGGPDAWGVPEWVAYEIKRFDGRCIPTHGRPGSWITDDTLFKSGVMPRDASYVFPRTFRSKHRAWFVRGHLAMKLHAERLGANAAWNTHTFYNAVPQRQSFNAGIWLDLENLTAAWAQHFGAVWIITGPVFMDKYPYAFLGEDGEFPVAIPEALFKIVVKESTDPERPDVLAFLYPQVGPGFLRKPYDHTHYLTTIDEIEALTGIDFLTNLPDSIERDIERSKATAIWAADENDFVAACRDD